MHSSRTFVGRVSQPDRWYGLARSITLIRAAALMPIPAADTAMPGPHLRRLAIIPIAFLIALLAPDPLPLNAADPPSPHEAAILDRIFANWKARHDRVHTLHFKWDMRATFKKGSPDPFSKKWPPPPLDRDQEFDEFGAQLWIEGDDRQCLITTPYFRTPRAKLAERDQVLSRVVTVGGTTLSYYGGIGWDAAAAGPGEVARSARIYRTPQHQEVAPVLRPLYLVYRPQGPSIGWSREQAQLVDDNALIDDIRCIKLKRVVDVHRGKREEMYWVSPVRDDAVVHWTIGGISEGSIKYKKDAKSGWVPWEWSVEVTGEALYEYKVTSYEINEKFDPSVFSFDCPAGTPVADEMVAGRQGTVHYSVVERDGSRRTITEDEFGRLCNVPMKKRPRVNKPAKPPR
jgi:hypothetical protein